MGRTARDRRDRPHPRPVERIELNTEHIGLRAALAAAFLILGMGLMGYSLYQFLTPQTEWITIEADGKVSCAQEFTLLYRPGESPGAEKKAVTALYTQLCRTAYEDFHSLENFEGVNNVYAINRHPNETLEVDGPLYEALAAVERSGSRLLYLGPVYERYNGVFSCQDDSLLPDFDPRLNPEVAREYGEYTAFANDPQAVRVELLGENRVRLYVSEAYLEYARQEGVERFIDFAWTRNAFIADYLAEELTAAGYTSGVLSSYDGFVRNLDAAGRDYSLQIYDRRESAVYTVALMHYRGPMSIVSLRDYPVGEMDRYRFYELASGEIRTPYVDGADGLSRSAVHNLVCCARDKGCGEIVLEMAPVYIADALREGALRELAEKGIDSVYCEDGIIRASQDGAVFSQVYEGYSVQ